MPSLTFNQTLDRRTSTFAIQIGHWDGDMDRVQDKDQDQKLTPMPQVSFLLRQIVAVTTEDRNNVNEAATAVSMVHAELSGTEQRPDREFNSFAWLLRPWGQELSHSLNFVGRRGAGQDCKK